MKRLLKNRFVIAVFALLVTLPLHSCSENKKDANSQGIDRYFFADEELKYVTPSPNGHECRANLSTPSIQNDPVALANVRKHLPGLVAMGAGCYLAKPLNTDPKVPSRGIPHLSITILQFEKESQAYDSILKDPRADYLILNNTIIVYEMDCSNHGGWVCSAEQENSLYSCLLSYVKRLSLKSVDRRKNKEISTEDLLRYFAEKREYAASHRK